MRDERTRHGLNVLKVRVKVRGLAAIDRRMAAAQALLRWRSELLRDLGGAENLSAQRLALVDLVVRTRLLVDHVDAFILGQPSLVNKRKKALLPIVIQRQSLVDGLSKLLGQLGLERVAKRVPELAAYLAAKEREP